MPHQRFSDLLPEVTVKGRRNMKKEPLYEEEHIDISTSSTCSGHHSPTFCRRPSTPPTIIDELTPRQQEVVFVAHTVYDKNMKAGVPEFLDANVSIGRFRIDVSSPWSVDVMPTIVGSMVPVMRIADEAGKVTIRCISGIECMQLQGWDLSHYADPQEACETTKNDLLINLAGNAYNGFALGAVFAAAFPALDASAIGVVDVDIGQDLEEDDAIGEVQNSMEGNGGNDFGAAGFRVSHDRPPRSHIIWWRF